MAGWIIGRTPGNDIIVSDRSVSRRHAELRDLGGGRYELADLGSSNGTLLHTRDGWQRIEVSEVYADDTIRFGDYETTVDRLLDAAGAGGGGSDRGGRGGHRYDPVAAAEAGGSAIEGMVPGPTRGVLQTAGILCFALAGLSLVFTGLAFAGPALASIASLLQGLLGFAWVFVLVVLKKYLNQVVGFDAANLPLTLVIVAQLVLSVAGVLFAVLGMAGIAAAPGTAAAMSAGLGAFAIVMLVLMVAYGGLMLWLGIALLRAKERLGGLYHAFAIVVIVTGGLFASIVLTVVGGLGLMAAWVVLGILMLQWAGQRR